MNCGLHSIHTLTAIFQNVIISNVRIIILWDKKMSGKGIKGCMYELKVCGKKGGAYRLLGNRTDDG